MTTAKQPTLFDREQPRSMEVAGPELNGVLADLKRRGAIVLSMTVRGTGRWLLLLDWKNKPKLL